jgi:hypothetical protein
VIVAFVAVIISVASISSSTILRPATLAPLVTTDELADGAVTGDKIAGNTITDVNLTPAGISRIASGSVGTDQIADNAITAEKIAENAIPEFFIEDNEITSAMIANDNVTSADIQDGTITNVDIGSTAAIDLSKLATYPFGLMDLAANSVDNTKIVDGSITSTDIRDGTITDNDISGAANIDPAKIRGSAWTAANDGPGSGLDADMVDGWHLYAIVGKFGGSLWMDSWNFVVSDYGTLKCYAAGIGVDNIKLSATGICPWVMNNSGTITSGTLSAGQEQVWTLTSPGTFILYWGDFANNRATMAMGAVWSGRAVGVYINPYP